MTQLEKIKQKNLQLSEQDFAKLHKWLAELDIESLQTAHGQPQIYRDLNHLAGTRSDSDTKLIEKTIDNLGQIELDGSCNVK